MTESTGTERIRSQSMTGHADGRNTVPGGQTRPDPVTPRLRLVVVGPVASGRYRRHPLGSGWILVGRAPDNDVVLDEPSVSARHARIDVEPNGVFVTDLGSTNGTWVDGRRLTGTTGVGPGSEIRAGGCVLRVEHDTTDPGEDGPWGPGAGTEPWGADPGSLIPARNRRTLLVSFDPADAAIGDRITDRLVRIGHTLLVERAGSADGWNGRLLDAVWSCDAVVFVVSQAAASSEKVHREVHLAGAERTTVIPVLVEDVALPPDLAWYVGRRPPVDLRHDVVAGLSELQRRLDEVRPKRVARPWRLARRLVLAAAGAAMLIAVAALVLG